MSSQKEVQCVEHRTQASVPLAGNKGHLGLKNEGGFSHSRWSEFSFSSNKGLKVELLGCIIA